MGTTEEELGRVARRQHGLIARGQAIALGVSESAVDRRLRSRQWLRFLPGVYRMPAVPDSDHQRILGACLAVGGGALASHRTAAFLWGLGPLHRTIEVSAAPHTRRALKGVWLHCPRDFALAGKAQRFDIPVTHLARTLVDLAATWSARDLEVAFDAAWRQRKDLPKWVARYLADIGARGRTGVHVLRGLVECRQARPTDSHHEGEVLAKLRAARLPLPVLQHEIFDHRGFVARADFAWVKERVALFGDSWLHHHGRRAFEHDHEQRERLAAAGWTPVEVTSRLVETGSWLESLARHLRRAA